MTPEEMKLMIGTEFTYIFEDGDSIPAYIKAFDPEIGLTCMTLDTETKEGWKPGPGSSVLEADGTFCVIGVRFKKCTLQCADNILTYIKETGEYKQSESILSHFYGCAFF
ncbi:MAG: hypothetical protein UU74_C0033G0005 [Candidatus Woesebacteria bacterium GW2011_GWA1_41_7]|uniref:Uncharacterized protein n=1 Tax=Candidatus Woesebacteria bacterium GW2011_GWA1_41_7 TaxID=1618556 RepID=A0A0G0ZUQ6_9BACT|nr:MAG: hypothetical protein UU74_C0033G0005 [Candidatus Woesebacteria bacterium GW2011_GWA1_41_7]